MIDIIGILTRSWLAVQSPAVYSPAAPHLHDPSLQNIQSVPLFAAPGAGSAATTATTPAKAPDAKAPDAKAAPAKAADPKAPAAGSPGTGAAPAPAAPTTASAVVNEVQKFYAGIKQVTATFRQSVTNNTFGSTKTSDGTVWLMKPGKMRWDYVEKKKDKVQVKKSFISNGSYLYVVEHDNKQVVKKNLANDLMPVAVTFLYGKGNLQAEFNPEVDTSKKYGTKDDIVLKLTPKKPSAQYKALYLVVAKDNYRVKQSVIVDSSNNINQFMFYAPDFDKSIKDTWFEFSENSVKNYRIIDADQQGSGASAPAALPPPSH
ncbi:MAG TPA: outer membrane lipoprotein carrier protein LolA [Kofleriaceae bacterium]|nr:outer membrane lipoprotein carrier protein LolA [Kofleriaceae bacterium]